MCGTLGLPARRRTGCDSVAKPYSYRARPATFDLYLKWIEILYARIDRLYSRPALGSRLFSEGAARCGHAPGGRTQRSSVHQAPQARTQHRGDVHGRHERFHQGLDQRRRTRVAGAAVRDARNPRRPLRHLRILRHDPQTLRALPDKTLRRDLHRRGAGQNRRHRPQGTTRAWA